MKYVGMAFLVVSIWLVGNNYSRKILHGYALEQEFLRFIKFIRGRVACYLEPPRRFAGEFASETLAECGFLPSLARCGTLFEAYESVRDGLNIEKDADEILYEYFSHSGKGYLENEIKSLDNTISLLDNLCRKRGEYIENRTKIVKVSSLALGLGLSILLL